MAEIDGDASEPVPTCERTSDAADRLSGAIPDIDTPDADRFVLVDYRRARTSRYARAMDVNDCEIFVTLQDDGRTVKVFLHDREDNA